MAAHINKNQLQCALCRERYQQPKLLDCLHSFCADCLKGKRGSNSLKERASSVDCPVCRQVTDLPTSGVDGLKQNFYLAGLLDEILVQEQVVHCGDANKLVCGSCSEPGGANTAVSRCLDCSLYLCASCQNAHTRFAALSGHKIVTLDEIRMGVAEVSKVRQSANAPECRKHYGEAITYFCETCQQLICRDCTLVDHSSDRKHVYTDVGAAFAERKQSLGELFPALHYALLVLEQSLQEAADTKRALWASSVEAIKDVRERAADMRAVVTAEENHTVADIERIMQNRESKFQEHADTVETMRAPIQHSLQTARDLVSSASKTDFLTFYSTISKKLKTIGGHRPPRIDGRLSVLRFKGSDGRTVSLGNLVVEGKWVLRRQFGKEGSGTGEFSCARGIAALPSGDIAVADQWNKRIVICGTDGTHKHTILTEDYPFDLASLNNQLIVIDTTNNVKVYNMDGTFVFRFSTVVSADGESSSTARVNLACIAVKRDGTVMIGDVQRNVVTEHRPGDGALLRTIPVKVPPHYLVIGTTPDVDSGGRMFISSAEKRLLAAVDATSGDTLFTIKPTIASERVDQCTGLCWDSTGVFLAVHNGSDTGHIHHYDTAGKFRGCVARDLHYPMSIKICAGKQQLAVADWTSVKIFQLENL